MRRNYISFKGDKYDGCGRHASVYHVYPVSRSTSEERAEWWKGGVRVISNSFRSLRCISVRILLSMRVVPGLGDG